LVTLPTPLNVDELISPVIPIEPVKELLPDIIIVPLSVCVSKILSPKILDPDENMIDDDSISVTTLFANKVPETIKSFSMNAFDAVTGPSISILPVSSILFLITKLVASIVEELIDVVVLKTPALFKYNPNPLPLPSLISVSVDVDPLLVEKVNKP
jgi:hypothetical protein